MSKTNENEINVTVENIVKNEVAENKPKKSKDVKTKKKFEATDGIKCRSIFAGELFMEGIKSHILYDWTTRNEAVEVEYQDLVAAIRSNVTYIIKPYLIIEDEDFLMEFPQLNKIYSSMYSYKDLKDILGLPVSQMITTIKELPEGAKESIKKIAATQINNGMLDSVNKIKALDTLFDTKLLNLTELFGV